MNAAKICGWLCFGVNVAPDFAQTDATKTRRCAPAFEDHFIAVFQETARFAGGKLKGIGSAASDLQQAALILFFRTGDRAASDQIARAQRTAIAGVMCDHLAERPI